MSGRDLRFGLIGCGQIGQLRAAALARNPSQRLVAVNDLAPESAAALAARYGASVDSDWRALLGRHDVDGVIISTPPSLHAEMCISALRAGKHVLCEKPLARTPSECRAIVDAAEQSGSFLATGFNYRFYSSIRKARAVINSGVIGEIDHMRGYAGYPARDGTDPWLRDPEFLGGGALRDNGIHLIDLARYFLGEVAEVQGVASDAALGFKGCEDNAFALLRSLNGKIASLQATWTEWRGYRFVIEIYGTTGCVRSSCFPMLTQIVSAPKRGARTHSKRHLFPVANVLEHLRSYRWVVEQSFVQELQAFCQALAGLPSASATGWDGLRAVEIADAIAASFGSFRLQPNNA